MSVLQRKIQKSEEGGNDLKKILFAIMNLGSGGAERSIVNLLHEISTDEYQIDLLLFKQEGLFLKQIPQNVKLIAPPEAIRRLYGPIRQSGKYLPVKLLGNAAARSRERWILDARAYRWHHWYSRCIPKLEGHYDTAIAYISGEILFFVDEKVQAERKLVWIHNDYRTARHPKKYDYPHLKNMDAIVSISDQCVDILKEEFPEWQEKIVMLPNITSSAATRCRAEEYWPKEYDGCEKRILSVGRLTNQKGFDMAVSAAALLKRKGVSFRWFVIGIGEKQQELEQQIKAEGVEDVFFLIGTRENPYPYMKHCTVLAQTSRYEGKSVVLDEAKILGAPIAVTNYPTVADQVADGKEGIVMEMTPEGIAAGLEALLCNAAKREGIRRYLLAHEYGNQAVVFDCQKLIDDSER